MRLVTYLFIFSLIATTLLAEEPTPEQQFCEAWANYRSSPIGENAMVLCKMLEGDLNEAALRADSNCLMFLEDDLMIVGYEMMSGNTSAFPLVLRLMQFIHGDDRETNLDGIGHCARMNPTAYLTAYLDNPADSSMLDDALPRVFSWYDVGKGFVLYELRERLKSLSSVTDPKLTICRDRCVSILETAIDQVTKNN